jgi:hypothetical protein
VSLLLSKCSLLLRAVTLSPLLSKFPMLQEAVTDCVPVLRKCSLLRAVTVSPLLSKCPLLQEAVTDCVPTTEQVSPVAKGCY